tara:strand:+ start:44 stop:376 length:333 start_codon:yes stop_codon:yes gene_type:complete
MIEKEIEDIAKELKYYVDVMKVQYNKQMLNAIVLAQEISALKRQNKNMLEYTEVKKGKSFGLVWNDIEGNDFDEKYKGVLVPSVNIKVGNITQKISLSKLVDYYVKEKLE